MSASGQPEIDPAVAAIHRFEELLQQRTSSVSAAARRCVMPGHSTHGDNIKLRLASALPRPVAARRQLRITQPMHPCARKQVKGKTKAKGDMRRRGGGGDDEDELDGEVLAGSGTCRLEQQPSCIVGEMREYQARHESPIRSTLTHSQPPVLPPCCVSTFFRSCAPSSKASTGCYICIRLV
jgi:hypothetical protein